MSSLIPTLFFSALLILSALLLLGIGWFLKGKILKKGCGLPPDIAKKEGCGQDPKNPKNPNNPDCPICKEKK